MYPPSSQYSLLPTDPEEAESPIDVIPQPKRQPWVNSLRTRRFAFLTAGSLALLLVAGLYWSYVFRHSVVFPSPDSTFAFSQDSRPSWVNTPPSEPLVLRIAVMTRVDGFERRNAIREAVFRGVRKEDVSIEYRFFVGAPPDNVKGKEVRKLIEEENEKFNDVHLVEEIRDIPERLSEKRYAALKWAGSVSNASYDYFLTMDSDTFVRFVPLARRLPELYEGKKVNPREEPVLIGRMSMHLTYFITRVPDGNEDPGEEDEVIKGPWFQYPAGIGYMLSSSLVKIFLSTDPPLPHHIHYPSDDVMIGAWIAALRVFHDETIEWQFGPDHPPEVLHPKPFLPNPVETLIIDDVHGWHDFPGRGDHDAPISWDSVCTHHVTVDEMKEIRRRLEFLGEWKVE